MNIQNLSTLKIHKLTQEQYDRELASGTLKENEIYLTPEEEIDLSPYATVEQLKSKADATHNHNDTYYTETEIDSKLAEINSSIAGKSDTNHEHDDKYYTEDEIDSKIDTLNTAISSKADSTHQHTGITDGDNSAIMQDYALLPMVGNGVLTTASSSTTDDTPEINLGSRGNTWGTAYVNEVYIKNAGDYLTEILKSKASDSAITSSIYSHNSSTSAHSDIRSLIDGLTSRLNALADSDDTTLDQLSEIVEYIKSNRSLIENVTTNKLNVSDVIDNLTTNVSNKALSANQGVAIKALIDALQSEFDGHTHAISEVTGLQSALDGKAGVSHGTHVTYSTEDPIMDGTAYAGSTSAVARSNHRHPTDTTRAAKADLDSHTSNTTVHITSTERTNWNAAKTHADSAHAPSNAEKNQNAFSNIVVGSTTVAADTATDTLTLAGSNVTLTPDATNDKITFSVADGSTSAKGILQLTDSTSSTSTTTAATPKSVKLAYDLASTAQDMADMAQSTADGKANASHTHTIANVTNLQNSLNAKQATVTGGASTITSSNLTTDRVLVSNSSGKVAVSDVTSTELGYLSGITNDIQAQLDGKASSAHTHKYAGSSSAGGAATSANKLNTNAGDSNTPVYFSDGVPVACTSLDLDTTGSSASCTGNAATATQATQDASGNVITNTYMTKSNPTGTGIMSVNRKVDSNGVGTYSVSMGYNNIASGKSSTALGQGTNASGRYSFSAGMGSVASGDSSVALGNCTQASQSYATAMGYKTTASSYYCTAMGYQTIASGGAGAIAMGSETTASGLNSTAMGNKTTALNYQVVMGWYNNTANATAKSASYGTSSASAFVIGNGTSDTASNAFRVDYNGTAYGKSAYTTAGCDYAEYFEWLDSNPNNEDRRGYFVTLDGEKIKIAEPGDYILGIISGHPAVIGNGDEDWMGRYILDDFGEFIYEDYEYETEEPEEVVDEETGEVTIQMKTVKRTCKKYKENPDYDPSIAYIQREDRPEWDAVGMVGVLSVRDDGTCQVNGYCKVAEGGTATASETGYRVIKRVNDNIVKVIFK